MLNKKKTGLAIGVFMVVVHFLWSIVVVIGLGKWAMDFAFKMHYLTNPFTIRGFTVLRFVGLMVMVLVVGYIMGWIYASVWNWASKRSE